MRGNFRVGSKDQKVVYLRCDNAETGAMMMEVEWTPVEARTIGQLLIAQADALSGTVATT